LTDTRRTSSDRLAFNTVLYRPNELEVAVAEISDAGYAAIELQPHLTLPLLQDVARRDALKIALETHSLRVAALMCGYLHDAASLERNVATVALAGSLDAGHLIVLPPRPEMCSASDFADLLAKLAEVCAASGVIAAVHHHAGTIVDTPDAIEGFLERTSHSAIGLCFDIAHYALFADDEGAAAGRFAARTSYVHVKDLARRSGELGFVPGVRNAQQSFRVTGDGVLAVGTVLSALRAGGYESWFSVEVENFYRTRVDSARVSLDRVVEALV
jgi:inosose dehydratase